jgi:hypothetical protein
MEILALVMYASAVAIAFHAVLSGCENIETRFMAAIGLSVAGSGIFAYQAFSAGFIK